MSPPYTTKSNKGFATSILLIYITNRKSSMPGLLSLELEKKTPHLSISLIKFGQVSASLKIPSKKKFVISTYMYSVYIFCFYFQ